MTTETNEGALKARRIDRSATVMAVANDLILNVIRDIAGNDISNSLDGSSKIANQLATISVSVYRNELKNKQMGA